jgi:hypothetical protein
VVFLPDQKAQEKEFDGPILPPEPTLHAASEAAMKILEARLSLH